MSDQPQKPDMDLIEMVQRARMINDKQAVPSKVAAVYWIEAKAPDAQPTPRAGTWVIPTSVDQVDSLWKVIKQATETGELGYKSKVSTSPGKDQASDKARLIHVRVADSANTNDVQRVRENLRKLGVTDDIAYVPDKPQL